MSIVMLLVVLLSGAGCSRQAADPSAREQALIFSVTETAGSAITDHGPILGKLASELPTEVSALVVADRLMRCGVNSFTVESASHVEYVLVPSTAKDLQVVECVQSKLDFSFGAGIGSMDDPAAANPEPFKALHAKKS